MFRNVLGPGCLASGKQTPPLWKRTYILCSHGYYLLLFLGELFTSISTQGPYLGVRSNGYCGSGNLQHFPLSMTSFVNLIILLAKFSKANDVSAGDKPMLLVEGRYKGGLKDTAKGKEIQQGQRGQVCLGAGASSHSRKKG